MRFFQNFLQFLLMLIIYYEFYLLYLHNFRWWLILIIMISRFAVIISISFFLMFRCSKNEKYSLDNTNSTLPSIASSVLKHYAIDYKDSLKYKAALFLLQNMAGHFSLDGEYLQQYQMKLHNTNLPYEILPIVYTLPCRSPEFNHKMQNLADTTFLDSTFIVRHIENKFKQKDSLPWLAYIDFETFCEYLLPYRFEEETLNLPLDTCSMFLKKLKYAEQYLDDCRTSFYNLTNWIYQTTSFAGRFRIPDTTIDFYQTNSNDKNRALVYLLRQYGIPATIDFILPPNKGDVETNWLACVEKRMKPQLPFTEQVTGKIYRYMYSKQNIPENTTNEYIPPFFKKLFYQDVTNEYTKTVDVTLAIKHPCGGQYAYLSVWRDSAWIPVTFGKINGNHCCFREMIPAGVYLPVCYEPNGKQVAVAPPFFLKKDGQPYYLKAEKRHEKELLIERIGSFFDRDYYYNPAIFNVLCSPYPDFRMADTLFAGNGENLYYRRVHLTDLNNQALYWKIESDKFRLSEIHFYDRQGNSVYPISNEDKGWWGDFNILSDNDSRTYILVYAGLVVSFKPGTFIDRIDIAGFSDGKNVLSGHAYELELFRNGRWEKLQSYTANTDSWHLRDIFVDGLYRIVDKTTDCQGDIFMLEKNKVRFQ